MECVSEKDKQALEGESNDEPSSKKQKLSNSEKKKLRGQNKCRGPTYKREKSKELCNTLMNVIEGEELPKCERKNCLFLHNIQEYLKIKQKDICE